MAKRTYPSDLTDTEWVILEPLLPPISKVGRPWKHSRRSVMNTIFYVLRTGSDWRYLPDSFPPWSSVYHHYGRWRRREQRQYADPTLE